MSLRGRLTVFSAVAVLLAASSLEPVFDSLLWLPRTVGAVLVVALAAALGRRLGLPRALQPVLSTVALLEYLVLVFAAATLHGGVLPDGATVTAFRGLLDAAGTDLSQYGPPAPATTPLVLLVVGGVGLVAVAVDAIACVAGRPAAAGLPLLALFAVPSAVLPGGLGWLPFVLGGAGWLGLLLVEGRDDAARWGTPLRTSASADPAGLGRVGRRIGGAALGVAVLVPLMVPGLDARLLDGGSGGGSGNGNGGSRSVTTYNPITRLRGELTLPDPIAVLHYTTNDPEPDYLRMTTLGIYDGNGWRQEVLRGNLRKDGVDDPIPTPVGRSSAIPTRAVSATVTIDTLDAFWLPVPATPSTLGVKGPWMWDPGSESVFATRSNTAKVGSYAVRSSRVLPDPALLAAGEDVVPAEVKPYDTPIEATDQVRSLTARIVRGQLTDYGKASALQAFFRDPDSGFSYADDTTTGGSPDALEDFLRQRQGFCEQYASAMAAMLRLAGVPSRVAVGFTPGTRQPDDSYLVTTSEAHAWPEAWFEGAGWVRFEPTPSRGGITPPTYGTAAPTGPQAPGSASDLTASPDQNAVAGETPAERQERLLADREDRAATPGVAAASNSSDSALVRVSVAGGLLVLLFASPALLHTWRRRRRWRRPSAGTAWRQLCDDATDTGHAWRPSESPRASASRLVREAGLTGATVQAVGRLTAAVERDRYARPGGATGVARPGGAVRASDGQSLAIDSATVRHALCAAATPRRRLRAVLVPPSTMRWATSWAGGHIADLLDAGDGLLSAAGARLRRRPT